ncbi:MAG: DUF1211 domain-containing protein [Bacilli bacterium]|nr:DUF1211 domain-containing protein [Bacilli bacterium]
MDKDRLIAFTDAILAIIMTILVLELKELETLSLQGLWALKGSYSAYTLSFFWLGTMWIGLHNEWQDVKKISIPVIWYSLSILFFSSLFPYVTKIVSNYFDDSFAQGLYGVIVVLTTLSNILLSDSLVKANAENEVLRRKISFRKRWLPIDLLIKGIGFIIAITVYPPAMMISVLLVAVFLALPAHMKEVEHL